MSHEQDVYETEGVVFWKHVSVWFDLNESFKKKKNHASDSSGFHQLFEECNRQPATTLKEECNQKHKLKPCDPLIHDESMHSTQNLSKNNDTVAHNL